MNIEELLKELAKIPHELEDLDLPGGFYSDHRVSADEEHLAFDNRCSTCRLFLLADIPIK